MIRINMEKLNIYYLGLLFLIVIFSCCRFLSTNLTDNQQLTTFVKLLNPYD